MARASFLTTHDMATGVTAPPAGISRATPAPTKAALNADVVDRLPPVASDAMPELQPNI